MVLQPVKMILFLIGHGYMKPSIYKLLFIFSGGLTLIIDGMMIHDQLTSEQKNFNCLFGFSFNLMKYATKFTVYNFPMNIFIGIVKELQGMKISLSTQHLEEMERENRRMKQIFLFIIILATSSHLAFVPFMGDENKYLCRTTVSDSIFMKFIFTPILFLVDGYSDVNVLMGLICVICQLNHHFHYISSCLEDMNVGNIDHSYLKRIEYQEMIGKQLKMCIQNHILIKRWTIQFYGRATAEVPMLVLSLAGILTVVTSISFIVFEISPPSNFRMILLLLKLSSLGCFNCYYGQLLTDQSALFHQKLSRCQWIYWNKKNRISLIIALSATAEPLKISCFGIYDLDWPYLLTLIRAAYSLFAVAINVK